MLRTQRTLAPAGSGNYAVRLARPLAVVAVLAASSQGLSQERGAESPRAATELRQVGAIECDSLAARLAMSEAALRRLEQRLAILVRDLELTETEVIRTKARLQGLETKADATSVIAETRVLIRRHQEHRGRTPANVRSVELLERAEQMIEEGNFGAATFLSLKAQELIKDSRASQD